MMKIYLMNFLLAISTAIGMTIIPFLITDSLGLSLLVVGILEGSTEFFSNLFRLINGVLFDKIKNRRLIFVCSTGIAFGSKLLLFLPTSWAILLAKTLERVANGAFASPRDAFVAEHATNKGMALGLLGVSKTLGCVLGPLMVSYSTVLLGPLLNNLQLFIIICCVLVLPAFLCSFFVSSKNCSSEHFSFKEIGGVFKTILPILILVFLFFMGRFNDGLLMIYLKSKGFPEWFYLSTIGIFNAVMLLTSPLIGLQIDKGRLNKMLFCTIGALITFNVCFYWIDYALWPLAILGLIGWGIQRTGAQIVFSAIIFRAVPKSQYGTAIGLFYVVNGVGILLASCISGYLANRYFSPVFLLSGSFAMLALVFALILNKKPATKTIPLQLQLQSLVPANSDRF